MNIKAWLLLSIGLCLGQSMRAGLIITVDFSSYCRSGHTGSMKFPDSGLMPQPSVTQPVVIMPLDSPSLPHENRLDVMIDGFDLSCKNCQETLSKELADFVHRWPSFEMSVFLRGFDSYKMLGQPNFWLVTEALLGRLGKACCLFPAWRTDIRRISIFFVEQSSSINPCGSQIPIMEHGVQMPSLFSFAHTVSCASRLYRCAKKLCIASSSAASSLSSLDRNETIPMAYWLVSALENEGDFPWHMVTTSNAQLLFCGTLGKDTKTTRRRPRPKKRKEPCGDTTDTETTPLSSLSSSSSGSLSSSSSVSNSNGSSSASLLPSASPSLSSLDVASVMVAAAQQPGLYAPTGTK